MSYLLRVVSSASLVALMFLCLASELMFVFLVHSGSHRVCVYPR